MQCLERIMKHIGSVEKAYEVFGVETLEDFLGSDVCQLAVAQAISNIHELRKKLREDTLNKLALFSRMGGVLKTARNIASHDYERLDLGIIYDAANRLQREQLLGEMGALLDELDELAGNQQSG